MIRKPKVSTASFPSAALLTVLFPWCCLTHVMGGTERETWTGSRVRGTPEPPPPFETEAIFSNVELNDALELVTEPGTGRWVILERGGRILALPANRREADPSELANLKTFHPDVDFLYGIAYHPRFTDNREVFLSYTVGRRMPEGTRLSRFHVDEEGRLDPDSEEILLTWLSGGHNGANLRFGPDGMLYVSTGDATPPSPPDALNAGQDLTNLLSAILRIDVDRHSGGLPYGIPPDNPFVGLNMPAADGQSREARGEIWAFGFRNPWKMSFDLGTGRLWCGDVGWELWEMIHLVERGGNYGWSAFEASQPIRFDTPRPPVPISPPAAAHSHDEAASITGGHVYHGTEFPELRGAYLYGDYETGTIWALRHDGEKAGIPEVIARTRLRIVAFGLDEDGEIAFLHYGRPSSMHRLRRNPQDGRASDFPRTLSATGLFREVDEHLMAPGVVPFRPAQSLFEAGAQVRHWIALPGESQVASEVQMRGENVVRRQAVWPEDAVLVRSLSLPYREGAPRWIETQLLHHDGRDWNGYTYQWNTDGSDAELVAAGGKTVPLAEFFPDEATEHEGRQWRFHSRSECLRCHNRWSDFTLAFHPAQLDDSNSPGRLEALGIVDEDFALRPGEPALTSLDDIVGEPADESHAGLETRARSWLHVHCAHCHRRHGGGSVSMLLNHDLPLSEAALIGAAPEQGGFGLENPLLVQPGKPWASVLSLRIATTGAGHMPAIGHREVDAVGLRAVEDWIASLDPGGETDDLSAAKASVPEKWTLAQIDAKLRTVDGAMQVRRAFDDGALDGDLRANALESARSSPLATVRDLFERFLPPSQRVPTLGPDPDPATILTLLGEADRGAALLRPEGKLATCLTCHVLGENGRDLGPDLTRIGARLDRPRLLDSLLHPSREIAEGYAAILVETGSGEAHTGFVVERGDNALRLRTLDGLTRTFSRDRIAKETPLPASLMPGGLLQSLTAQEAADLLEYLVSLK